MKKKDINFKTTSKVTLAAILSMLLLACGNGIGVNKQESSSPSPVSDLKQLDEAFKNIEDETSALAALTSFENYANKKVAGGFSLSESNNGKIKAFSLSESLAKKLTQKEWAFRQQKEINANRVNARITVNESGDEVLDLSELCDQKIESLDDGISSQELASIINNISQTSTSALRLQSNVITVTDYDIEKIQDKTRVLLPHLNDVHNTRISPMEALVIGYTLSTQDDGTSEDQELTSYASPEQMTAFIQKISE